MYDENASKVMRSEDADSFRRVAMVQKVYIIVRQTNRQSIQWIGQSDYIAKPIDCKPKTADKDVVIDGRHIETAGLVVNPELPGFGTVFENERKAAKAGKAWKDFIGKHPPAECRPRDGKEVRTWPGANPGWAVQMCKTSKHYGCLLYSTYPQGMNGKYVHGDYDLMGIAAASDPSSVRLRNEELSGQPHSRGPNSQSVQFSVNAMSGLPLIRHGEQELFADFDEEPLDVLLSRRQDANVGQCGRRPGVLQERTEGPGGVYRCGLAGRWLVGEAQIRGKPAVSGNCWDHGRFVPRPPQVRHVTPVRLSRAEFGFGLAFGTIEQRPVFERYRDRIRARPATARTKQTDDALIAGPMAA